MFYFISQLLETNVLVRARQVDISLVDQIVPQVQEIYKNVSKKEVNIKLDTEHYLPADSCGGIDLIAARGTLLNKNYLC